MGFGPMNNYYREQLSKYKRITVMVLLLTMVNLLIIILIRTNYIYQTISLIIYLYLGYEFGARRIIIYPNLIVVLLVSILIQIGLLL